MSDIMIEINAICEFDENRKDFLFQIIPIMEDLEGFVGKDANLEEVGQHIGAAIDRACVSYNKKLCQKDARIKELEDENGKLMAIFESVRNLDQYSANKKRQFTINLPNNSKVKFSVHFSETESAEI